MKLEKIDVTTSQLSTVINDLYNNKQLQLKLMTATDERANDGGFRIWYVFGVPGESTITVVSLQLTDTEQFPSITAIVHNAVDYERKIRTFFGLNPIGHPDPRAIILQENWPATVFPLRKDFDWQTRPEPATGVYPFQEVRGEGIYEIPVGPIHAGIIEPGHFRFSVAGEEIILLEPRLGYTHKGSEKLFETLPLADKIKLSEKISGDSSFSHSLAFCQGLEELSDTVVPERAQYLRVIFAELERLANHFGDIGAMMLDTGFNFGGAHGARLREQIMQLNERLTGSRFLRGVNRCGGVTHNINTEQQTMLLRTLANVQRDFNDVMNIAENSASLLNRLKGTGKLPYAVALDLAATGVAAKAIGIDHDTRFYFPYAAYPQLGFSKIKTETTGDACARFNIRIKEVAQSIHLIEQAVQTLPNGSIQVTCNDHYQKNSMVISLVEGWRGEILYAIATDRHGTISRVVPRDPSVVNWALLPYAGAHNVVPDFPLINKSFNLSYSGNDL